MKRPESHIKEKESFAYVEDTLKEWVLNRCYEDYGIDYDIQVFEEGEGRDLNFGAQIKSTEISNMDSTYFKFRLDTEHIQWFLEQKRPILFVVYYIPKKIAYWVVMQEYVWHSLDKENPNWLNQKSSTIKLPLENLLTNKEEVRNAGRRCRNEIMRRSLFSIPVHERLGLDGAFEDIQKLEDYKKETEFTLHNTKLLIAKACTIKGDYETAVEELTEVYRKKKEDLLHLHSIIGLIGFCNISIEEDNKIVFSLADEGIQIAEQLDSNTELAILSVYRAQALHLTAIKRIAESLYRRKVRGQLDIDCLFVGTKTNERVKQLLDILTQISSEVSDAFKILIDSKNYYILIFLLTVSLDMTTRTIQLIGGLIGKEKFEDEIKSKDTLAHHLINLIEVFADEELELSIRESVAMYYYYTRGGEDALKILTPASELVEKRKNQSQTERISFMISRFKKKPNPYSIAPPKIGNLSTREYTEYTKLHNELMGVDLNDDSSESSAIRLGLKDMNPEPYLRYCEELYIHYANTSYLGEISGIPSIGYKLLWCKYSKVTCNYNLNRGFESHKRQYCRNCGHRKPRPNEWVCTVEWFREREIPKPIQEFRENMMKW